MYTCNHGDDDALDCAFQLRTVAGVSIKMSSLIITQYTWIRTT